MKILVMNVDENVGGVALKKGEHTDEQLTEKKVDRRAVANLVARGRASWKHGKPAAEKKAAAKS